MELDMPVGIVTNYGHVQIANEKSLESILAGFFNVGDVITVHLVAETTGEKRAICKWIAPDSQYKNPCSHVCDVNGVCPLQQSHDEKDAQALQTKMDLAD